MGPSSYHPGGCHFTIADGSVRFLFEEIDAAQISQEKIDVLHFSLL